MRYRRAIAFLRKHPELLDDAFVMPLSEAERLLQADPPPTFAEMIARAKEQHPECPPERWAAYDRILARQTAAAESAEGVAVADAAAHGNDRTAAGVAEGAAVVEGAPESGRPVVAAAHGNDRTAAAVAEAAAVMEDAPESGWPVVADAHGKDRTAAGVAEDAAVLEGAPESGRPVVAAAQERRSAGPRRWRPVRAAAGVVAAAALFLALVPAGRTFAHDVLHYLVGVFGNTVTIARQEPTATATAQAEAILYDDLASFTADTGLVPFVLDADWLQIDTVYGRYSSEHGCILWIIYVNVDGYEIHSRQEWLDEWETEFEFNSEAISSFEIYDGLILYANKKPSDSWYDGFIELDDSLLFLGASDEIGLSGIIDALQ